MSGNKKYVFSGFENNRMFYDALLRRIFVEVLCGGNVWNLEPDELFPYYDGRKGLRNGWRAVRLGYVLSEKKIAAANESISRGRKVEFQDIVHLRRWAKEGFGLNVCDVYIASEGITWDWPCYREAVLHNYHARHLNKPKST